MRKEKEALIDCLLLMHLLRDCHDKGYTIDGRLKWQKLVFISELEMLKQGEKGFHFKFFTYNLGPYSKELAEDCKELVKKRLVRGFKLTDRGVEILNLLWEAILKEGTNRTIAKKISESVDKYGKYAGQTLKNKVYLMEMEPYDRPGCKLRIKDIPPFIDLVVPACFDAEVEFTIPDDLLGILKEELKLTEDEIKRIEKKSHSINERAKRRLLEEINLHSTGAV